MRRNQTGFLNTAGSPFGMKTGTSNKRFWADLTEHARAESAAIQDTPKSQHYRDNLAPYLHMRVQVVSTKGWKVVETFSTRTRICLNDAMLVFARSKKGQQEKVRVPTGHLHILVDNTWLRFVNPQPNEDLLVNGVFYEYVNAHGYRNIAVMPVVVTPIENHHKTYQKKPKRKNGGRKESPQE